MYCARVTPPRDFKEGGWASSGLFGLVPHCWLCVGFRFIGFLRNQGLRILALLLFLGGRNPAQRWPFADTCSLGGVSEPGKPPEHSMYNGSSTP